MSLFATPYKRAIAYYRHSAEDKQENSVPIQREHIQKFARDNHIEVIHEEADEGETGLLASRPGFTHIFDDWILRPQAPAFDFVLVYDVSRWGRFQDQDEAAYYEFICRKQGKRVIYVARGFPQEEYQLIAHLQTSIERYMAAEYSRQLSVKVFHGCIKVSQAGYSAGGTACYGMGRLLLDVHKHPVRILKHGEHKSIDNERVTFVPLDDKTTEVVRNIFSLFVKGNNSEHQISEILNRKNIAAPNGGKWHEHKIMRILTNAVYVGSRIYNKTSNRLKTGKRNNPRREWVICEHAHPAIVDPTVFQQAQEKMYWQRRSQWKRGFYTIRRVRALLAHELRDLVTREAIEFKQGADPFLFSVASCNEQGTSNWCFTITDAVRRHREVIGVSVQLDMQGSIDRFFVIPTKDFGLGGFKLFSEDDGDYQKYILSKEKVEIAIRSIITQNQ